MKRINILPVLFAIAILFASCEDFLEKVPQQNLTTESAIAKYADAQVAVNGVYDALQSSNYYGRNFVVIGDVAADNVKISTSGSGRFLSEYNYSVVASNGDITSFWNIAYDAIDRANNVLAKIDGLSDGTEAQKNQLKGEALFLRALVHFDLVRFFAQPYNCDDASVAENANGAGGHLGVPIMLVSEISEPARNTVAEVYAQVIIDLTDAANLMTIAPASAGYASKWGAKALLARVYYYMNDWTNAATFATEVINSGSYSLVSNTEYIASWVLEFTSESIFSVIQTSTDYRSTNALGYIYLESGYGDALPMTDIMDLYESTDVRTGWFYVADDGGTYVKKYPGHDGTDGLDNTPVLRLSDLYLMRAYAYANGAGTDNQAIIDLDIIRMRADPSVAATVAAGEDLRNAILLERRKELAFEGHRKYDLVNAKKDIRRTDCTLVTCDTPYPDFRFAYPIPQREMDVNDNMVQNKGY